MDSTEMDENRAGDNVLYELLVYKEWELDREKQRKIMKSTLLANKKPRSILGNFLWNNFNGIPWPEEDLAKAASLLLPWQIAVSPNGKLVAVLQDSVLELRQSKDEYTTVVGRASVPKDDRPQLRKICWSPDTAMIAVASSDGSVRVYDCVGSLIFKIPLLAPEIPTKNIVTGLEFITARERKHEWELLIIYATGNLDCYSISSFDKCTLDHTFVLSETGISYTLFSSKYGILFASMKPLSIPTAEGKKLSTGITAWRLLNETPYYQRVFPTDEELAISRLHGRMQTFFTLFSSSDCICQIKMSPSNEYLATLNASGIVYIWVAPSLRLHSSLEKIDFKKQKVLVSLSETGVCSHVIDIEWRKDSKLIVAWKNGTISIHDVNTQVVLTYFGTDFLRSVPRLASASTLHGFLALECQNETVVHPSKQFADNLTSPGNESDQSFNESRNRSEDSSSDEEKTLLDSTSELFKSTMYLITDLERYEPKRKSVKFFQRTYRLLGVKMTTPEELFERYLKNEEFERAFEICQEYGLDVKKVYMRQWRTSEVNKHSIHEYLAKIDDEDFVLNECLERVPETLSGAKNLIEFGLSFTDINPESEGILTSGLTEKQKFFISSRLKLLNYADKLQTYELIFDEGSYSNKYFEKFRNQSIVSSAVDFARSANSDAVKLLMTCHGNEVLPFWLNILDNYPESIRPRKYQDILPECDGDMKPVEWVCFKQVKQSDWALQYSSQFIDPSVTEETPFSEIYTFDTISLSEWYKKRAIEFEENSSLIENSVDLLEIGIQRNIQDLEELFDELKMLSVLVYDLNISMTYSKFHLLDLPTKLKMFVQEPHEFCEATLKWVHPYLEHYADRNSLDWLSLYKDFMIFNSRSIFGHVIKYYKHILDGNLHIIGSPDVFLNVLVDCVYAYEELDQLEKTVDLIADAINWLSSLSDEYRRSELFDKLFSVQNELRAGNILIKNNFSRSVSYINEIKCNKEESESFILKFTHTRIQNLHPEIEDWEQFLEDLVDLQRYCFSLVTVHYCYEIFVSCMLRSGNPEIISYASNLLCCSEATPEEHLSFYMSVNIVLEAAEYYFNSAMNVNDINMNLAKLCLSLIKDDHPTVQEEQDLIIAVRLLCGLGINILPLQVRQTENKMKLIDLCFDKNITMYQNPQLIYKIAAKLHIFSPSIKGSECCVTLRLAQEAFKKKDFQSCADFCSDLIPNQFEDGWFISLKLSECNDYDDIERKKELLTFAMLHSPPRMLPHIMCLWSKFDSLNLYKEMTNIIESMLVVELNPSLQSLTTDIQKCVSFVIDPKEALHQFHTLWKRQSFKERITSGSSNDFFLVCPSVHSSVHSESCNFYVTRFEAIDISTEDKILQLINYILKLVIRLATDNAEISYAFFIEALISCSILSASTDSALTLCFLLCLKDPRQSEMFFNSFKESHLLYQYRSYYLGLKHLSTSNIFPFYSFCSPSLTISSLLEKNVDNECKTLYNLLLHDFKNFCEASQVTSFERGIDKNRFKIDEKYKHDTIFGLALNEDIDSLMLAIELAEKNNIPAHDVVISHIISLLINNEHTIGMDRITYSNVMISLIENSEECLKRLMETWPSLCGTNHLQLTFFFNLVKLLNKDYIIDGLTPKEHISLLKKVKSLSKDIDYKNFISGKYRLVDVLEPVLSSENTLLIAKFLKSLPNELRLVYHIGTFYCQWAIIEFRQKCMLGSFRQCMIHFESLKQYLNKCSIEDIHVFLRETLFLEDVVVLIDVGLRKEQLASLINWCMSISLSEVYKDLLKYLQEKLELHNRLWDEDYGCFTEALIRIVFFIECNLTHESGEQDKIRFFKSTIDSSPLKKTDLFYLYKILRIKTPLSELMENVLLAGENNGLSVEWREHFHEDTGDHEDSEDFRVPFTQNQPNLMDEGELIQCHINSLWNLFNGDLRESLLKDVNLKSENSCFSFFMKLLESTTSFEQLTSIHKFILELPASIPCNKNDINVEILKKSIKICSKSHTKYTLIQDLLKTCSFSLEIFEDLLKRLPAEDSELKLFIYYICLHSNDNFIKQSARLKISNDEDQMICDYFMKLPRIATDILIPHLFNTSIYHKLINKLKTSMELENVKYWIKVLKKSACDENTVLEAEITKLELFYCYKNSCETTSSLLSFHTLLQS